MNSLTESKSDWFFQEMKCIQMPDKRLSKRLLAVGASYSSHLGSTIGPAMGTPAAAKAAYRLFNNSSIHQGDILRPHTERTVHRMSFESIVICAHDSMILGFSSHKKMKGLGTVGGAGSPDSIAKNGLLSHHAMVFSEQGVPLGVLSQETLARRLRPERRTGNKTRIPASDKESYRWLLALVNAQRLAPTNCCMVHVADREADFLPFMAVSNELDTKFVVRAQHDRRILGTKKKVSDCLKQHHSVVGTSIFLAGNGNRKPRVAHCEIKFLKETLRPPDREGFAPIEINVMKVEEVSAHPDKIDWTLFTNIEVTNASQALEIIKYYSLRWGIEEYHKVLKSGLKVEDCRLEDAEAFGRYLELMMIFAWRIFWLTKIARSEPNTSSLEVLSELELEALYALRKKTPPETPPDVKTAIEMIAWLGGHYQVKGRPFPGPTVIWRGWLKLQQFLEVMEQVTKYRLAKSIK